MAVSMDRWVGQTAIVTGASSGIGYAIALNLAQAGLKVVAVARRKEKLEELKAEAEAKKGSIYPYKADMTKEDEILNMFKWASEHVGPIHVLVNNAGLIRPTNLTEGNTQMWKDVLDTNILGLCIATREAVQNMRSNKINGHIIHINSITGHRVLNVPGFNIYMATKHAVTALTETLRNELNAFGDKIKISSVSPGLVGTEIFNPENVNGATWDSIKSYPFLNSEDIAEAVKYILGTPPHVQVHELTIKPVGEPF